MAHPSPRSHPTGRIDINLPGHGPGSSLGIEVHVVRQEVAPLRLGTRTYRYAGTPTVMFTLDGWCAADVDGNGDC